MNFRHATVTSHALGDPGAPIPPTRPAPRADSPGRRPRPPRSRTAADEDADDGGNERLQRRLVPPPSGRHSVTVGRSAMNGRTQPLDRLAAAPGAADSSPASSIGAVVGVDVDDHPAGDEVLRLGKGPRSPGGRPSVVSAPTCPPSRAPARRRTRRCPHGRGRRSRAYHGGGRYSSGVHWSIGTLFTRRLGGAAIVLEQQVLGHVRLLGIGAIVARFRRGDGAGVRISTWRVPPQPPVPWNQGSGDPGLKLGGVPLHARGRSAGRPWRIASRPSSMIAANGSNSCGARCPGRRQVHEAAPVE